MNAKLPKGTLEALWKDPANWRGPFYYCKEDPRGVVPKKIKSLGWTINFARASGWWGLVIGIAGTIAPFVYLKESGHIAWLIPAAIALVVLGVASAMLLSSPKRFEE
jgi:hypothetical protein